jgi:hypothetical protein
MYAMQLTQTFFVVMSKFGGLQKWLAPFGTDAQRVARTIDVYP